MRRTPVASVAGDFVAAAEGRVDLRRHAVHRAGSHLFRLRVGGPVALYVAEVAADAEAGSSQLHGGHQRVGFQDLQIRGSLLREQRGQKKQRYG